MIPSLLQQQSQQDRYSVVVLDYPRREKQDIECYCIPSSNLEDHGYIPYEEETAGEHRDDHSIETKNESGRPMHQSPSSKGRVWNRLLWSRNKSMLKLDRLKAHMTEAELTKYISSQDDLDWSMDENVIPANPNPKCQSAIHNILQPLVQIYVDDGKEDVDDSISAMSPDTCWQDESQGVVELVLPNVLFCDKRDDSEKKDFDSWSILFPSYFEECQENARDDHEAMAMKDPEEPGQVLEGTCEECLPVDLDDDTSVSSGGWEDVVTETESESEKGNPIQEEKLPELIIGDDTNQVDMSTVTTLEEGHATKRPENGEEEDIEVEFIAPPLPPPDLMLPALQPLLPFVEQQSVLDVQPAPSVVLPAAQWQRASSTPAMQRHFFPHVLKKSPTTPISPKRSFSRRPCIDQNLFGGQKPSHLSQGGIFPGPNANSVALNVTRETTLCDVKEIDVLSDCSHSSNLTNPSMFSSATWSPPPSPPKNCFRSQRRGSISKFLLQQPSGVAVSGIGGSPPANLTLELNSLGSILSNAGSRMEENPKEDIPIDATVHTGLLSGFMKRVLDIPSYLFRRKDTMQVEGPSSGNSAFSDVGDDNAAASWASVSLRSLGGFSAFEDCEEESKWWELGSTLLLDQVSCSVTDPVIVSDNSIDDEADNDIVTCDSQTTVFEDANEDDDDRKIMSSPVLEQKLNESKMFHETILTPEDDPWCAAKRGDVDALQKWTSDKSYDWSQKDAFGNTALFYACHSGAAINITIVKHLLDNWPIDQIPADVLDRCKLNAINSSVIQMLKHPEDAEKIAFSVMSNAGNADTPVWKEDDESLHLSKWLLYDVDEGDEEGDY